MTQTVASVPVGPPFVAIHAEQPHAMAAEIRDRAYPVIPDPLPALVSAEDEITAAASQLTIGETFGQWAERTADALVQGEALPADFADAAQIPLQAAERHRVALLTLSTLRGNLKPRWSAALRDGVDEMLAGLGEQLEELLAEIRAAAAQVAGVDLTDTEAVARATESQLGAIEALGSMRSRYGRLRELQEKLLTNCSAPAPRHRSWAVLIRSRIHEFRDVAQNGTPAEDLSPVLWFRRVLNRDDVWLPTLSELRETLKTEKPKRVAHGTRSPRRPDTSGLTRVTEAAVAASRDLLDTADERVEA